jgi:chromosome segregation ATPase
MSFVGKMLIVLQVVLSIVFMAFAGAVYTTHQNWMTQAGNLESEVSRLQTEVNDAATAASAQISELTQQRDAAAGRADMAEAENVQLRTQLENEAVRSNRVEAERQSFEGLAGAKSVEASFRDEEAQRQRIAYQTLRSQNDELAANLRNTEDALFAANLERQALAERFDGLLAENGDLKRILRLNDLPSDPSEYAGLEEPPPPVDGLVLATMKDKTNRTELVEISIGSDDGLLKSHELDVFRAASGSAKVQYLGKIRITLVTPDRAVGYVVQAAKNGIIERGDNVTTKL